MNTNKALWEKGDFTCIAATMREGGEALVKTLSIAPGIKVLALGCGDGTTAIPAAKLGARGFGCGHRQKSGRGRKQAGTGAGVSRVT